MVWRHSARWQFAAIVSLMSLMLLVWPAATEMLMWKRAAIADDQAWRWMTGHLVHLNARHCLSNLLGLFVICEYLWDELGLAEAFLLSVWTAAGTSMLLWWFAPEIQWYAGLSGILHGLWSGCAMAWWCRTGDRVAGVALLLLAIKLVLPTYTVSSTPVVTVAHDFGALSGLAWAVLRARARRFEIFG
ncbi:MAG: rhombosortase [Pseudomonadota bacterium]|jgi:rhomboid family GlyGly-CTERM serine protease